MLTSGDWRVYIVLIEEGENEQAKESGVEILLKTFLGHLMDMDIGQHVEIKDTVLKQRHKRGAHGLTSELQLKVNYRFFGWFANCGGWASPNIYPAIQFQL